MMSEQIVTEEMITQKRDNIAELLLKHAQELTKEEPKKVTREYVQQRQIEFYRWGRRMDYKFYELERLINRYEKQYTNSEQL